MTENEMTNQAAQTMPERTYMTRDEALKIARACAYAKCHTHGYLPRTAKEAADWQPHEWVLDAIRWNAILQPVRVSEAGVPEGWVLVPARMELTPENMETLVFMLGGDPDAKDVDERWNGGTLWVGETVGDNGEKYYGLNVANVECYDEGSIPIVEFAAAQAASGVHPDALPDGTLSKSTAKRVTALASASVSERARAILKSEMGGFGTDTQGRIPLEYALRAIEQALTQQRGEAAASGEGVDDTKRLDWIARQGGYEFDFGILNDQPGDGDWFVHGMGGSGQGATFRDAIDAAIKEEAGGQDANTDILDTLAFKTENGDAGRGSVTYIALVASGEADHATTTPQPSADAVRELVKRWRGSGKDWYSNDFDIRGSERRKCADELESLLSGGSHA